MAYFLTPENIPKGVRLMHLTVRKRLVLSGIKRVTFYRPDYVRASETSVDRRPSQFICSFVPSLRYHNPNVDLTLERQRPPGLENASVTLELDDGSTASYDLRSLSTKDCVRLFCAKHCDDYDIPGWYASNEASLYGARAEWNEELPTPARAAED